MKKHFSIAELNFTETEKELVINELAERLKDLVYMTAKEKSQGAYEQMYDMQFGIEDKITMQWNVCFVIGDFIQIAGRQRR